MIVPSGFSVSSAGTVTPVNVTSPGFVPITGVTPSSKSLFATTLGVVSPLLTGVPVKSSSIASITFSTSTVAVAVSQLIGFAPISQISYTTVYVPDGVFGLIVIVPSAFKVSSAGTVTPVSVTSPGLVPITTG